VSLLLLFQAGLRSELMVMEELIINVENMEVTDRIGRRLGRVLTVGHVIGLIGPLGSGKTTLVKSIAAGAEVKDLRQVNSPTFVIVNEYETHPLGEKEPLRIHHVDTYRLRGGGDLEALGFDELCSTGAVIIEWADRVSDVLPADLLTIYLEPIGESQRRFRCQAGGANAAQLLAALAAES